MYFKQKTLAQSKKPKNRSKLALPKFKFLRQCKPEEELLNLNFQANQNKQIIDQNFTKSQKHNVGKKQTKFNEQYDQKIMARSKLKYIQRKYIYSIMEFWLREVGVWIRRV